MFYPGSPNFYLVMAKFFNILSDHKIYQPKTGTMKNSGLKITAFTFSALLFLSACNNGADKSQGGTSGSESQTTKNDSSGAESRSAIGTNEDNQKKESGYPSNQSNLNSDSTSRKHDIDTLKKTSI